jgi:hypothetical protein
MTSRDFVIWLKGFVAASHNYNITPKQWDELREQLSTVNDKDSLWDVEPNETLLKAAEEYKDKIK